jgi:hypothetical protein
LVSLRISSNAVTPKASRRESLPHSSLAADVHPWGKGSL